MQRTITPFKRLRFELGVRQIDIAHRTAISISRLSLIENGHVTARDSELARIAAALGVSAEVLGAKGEAAL
jgi:transcriptional regulator with XRE-family HTH domain